VLAAAQVEEGGGTPTIIHSFHQPLYYSHHISAAASYANKHGKKGLLRQQREMALLTVQIRRKGWLQYVLEYNRCVHSPARLIFCSSTSAMNVGKWSNRIRNLSTRLLFILVFDHGVNQFLPDIALTPVKMV
jgi:hypothetical protein